MVFAEDQEWLWKMCVVASKAGLRRMEIVSIGRPVNGVMSQLSEDKQMDTYTPEVEKTKHVAARRNQQP